MSTIIILKHFLHTLYNQVLFKIILRMIFKAKIFACSFETISYNYIATTLIFIAEIRQTD